VNRYKDDGTQWYNTENAYYCGNVGEEQTDANGDPIPCTSKWGSTDCDKETAAGKEMAPGSCVQSNGSWVAKFIVSKMDGNPTFFPVDNDPFSPASEAMEAQIPPYYDVTKSWPKESVITGVTVKHNFSFTSEVRYWFKFEKSKSYTLEFVGDDDVWVFINKKLAADLGGIHTPVDGSVTLDASTASKFGLSDGNVYEAVVFQAERQTTGSSYKLTLSGFNAAPSICHPDCGDGILEIGEECDDGPDNGKGGYGSCGADCTLQAGFCGDGVVQVEDGEDCDDGGNNGLEGYCPSGCHYLIPIF
jgi:fibro-slime domain-containing protein